MRTSIKSLFAENVDIKPINFDWSIGYTETWDYIVASRCEKCNHLVLGRGDEKHSDIDSESDCDGYVPLNEGPMMNYFYPVKELRESEEETAKAIADLPLCLVRFEESGEHGLALTGGGMDLSWEICEAFMLAGFLPPVHFADLPQMADRGKSTRDRWIIAGCRASAQVVKNRAGRVLRNLRTHFKSAKA